MARTSTLILCGLGLCTLGFTQVGGPAVAGNAPPAESPAKETLPLRSIRHDAFRPGEKLTYVVHYGFINAGEAVVELRDMPRTINGRKVWQAVGTGRSLGAFNTFYKVDDHYSSVFDAEGVFPWVFSRSVSEGGYEFKQDYVYHQHKRQVTTQRERTHDVPPSVQDMLSAFYYARTIDFSRATPGDIYVIDCFLDDELWPLRMKYIGRETIKLRNGTYKCLKFQPVVQEGRIFKGNNDLNVWVTDDGNRIPVLVQAKVLVGSIKMQLTGYEGLAHPIAKN
ncbi:MAG: DUF3108 domain-containing protein [Flavobacteriales bacterium]|nr:DUF3108 domain-containing protein [Flavobacteriales bacterium]